MRLLESIVGNINQPEWAERLAGATVDVLALDQWEAQKNRFRKPTRGGVEVAISLDRSNHLQNGDILAWDETTRTAIVAEIDLKDVLIVDLSGLTGLPSEEMLRTAVELGHALGNQHWPAVMKGLHVYVPLTVDRTVMASVMRTHAFPGITYSFAPGAEVIPYLAPHEARRLFGGAEGPIHRQTHEHKHPHG
ncbi:MAG: urease accessory protein UreE [Anaerolineales bacterium]|nr:urease accessory protein UreE [Anaerolineales bacterium]